MSRVSPMQPSVDLSLRSLDSQEQLEAALRDLMLESNERNGLCKGDAITDAGKRRQLLKMLGLTMTPLFVLLGVTFYFLAESAAERAEVNTVSSNVAVCVEIARSVHVLQMERDYTAFFLSPIGHESSTLIVERYMETDQELDLLSRWPTNLDLEDRPQFKSLDAFQAYLANHRNGLDLLTPTVYEEMDFYTNNIQIFILWLYNSITESRFGTIWKTLVAYQKIVSGKEEVGIERALGSAFFYRGGFDNHEIYLQYIKKTNTFQYSYRSAQNYSPIVRPIANLKIRNAGMNLTRNLDFYRDVIQHKNISYVSEKEATRYYDNMTMYIDILLEIQRSLAKEILEKLDESSRDVTANIIISSVLIFVVLALCPIQIQAVYKQTSDIQSYALTLADKTRELNKEKRRTDSLLYQMLPRPVADQLKNKKDVNAEYYKDVTVFFSGIDGFTKLSSECSPMQIVELLKELYGLFDGIIEQYDVYKVETIGEQYMVASGLPTKNGKRHATEIANMSLELLGTSFHMTPINLPGHKIRLRIGVHSGPVMAGVVGTKLPRYCLFGDTVNTASRMESNGMPNRIHITSSTQKNLSKNGVYAFKCRGPIEIKGKGQMVTYWLTGRGTPVVNASNASSQVVGTDARSEKKIKIGKDKKIDGTNIYSVDELVAMIPDEAEVVTVPQEDQVVPFDNKNDTQAADGKIVTISDEAATTQENDESQQPLDQTEAEIGSTKPVLEKSQSSEPPSIEQVPEAWNASTSNSAPPEMIEGYHY